MKKSQLPDRRKRTTDSWNQKFIEMSTNLYHVWSSDLSVWKSLESRSLTVLCSPWHGISKRSRKSKLYLDCKKSVLVITWRKRTFLILQDMFGQFSGIVGCKMSVKFEYCLWSIRKWHNSVCSRLSICNVSDF